MRTHDGRALMWHTLLVVLVIGAWGVPALNAQQGCPPTENNSPHVVGSWGPVIGPFFPPVGTMRTPFPMHAILLKTGQVLVLPTEGSSVNDMTTYKVMLFDPANPNPVYDADGNDLREFLQPQLTATTQRHIISCAGHSTLPDGRILFTGGGAITVGSTPVPADRVTIFDPDKVITNPTTGELECQGCWITQPDMPRVTNFEEVCPEPDEELRSQRYYPTNTALADGRVLVMGGASESDGCQLRGYEGGNTPMIFDPSPQSGSKWKSLTDGRGLPGPGLNSIEPSNAECITGCVETVFECNCPDNDPNPGRQSPQYPADWDFGGNEDIPNRFHVHYYPHNFLLPDAGVYMAGSLAGPYGPLAGPNHNIRYPCPPGLTCMVGECPSGQTCTDDPVYLGPVTGKFNTAGLGSWSDLISDGLPIHQGATVMYAPNKLLKAGGSVSGATVTNKAFKIDLIDDRTRNGTSWCSKSAGKKARRNVLSVPFNMRSSIMRPLLRGRLQPKWRVRFELPRTRRKLCGRLHWRELLHWRRSLHQEQRDHWR